MFLSRLAFEQGATHRIARALTLGHQHRVDAVDDAVVGGEIGLHHRRLGAGRGRDGDLTVVVGDGDRLTAKWTLLVLNALCEGPMRFNALRRTNPGVTQKALTQCLRRLEASGFITRKVVSTGPVAVVYEISSLGRSLEPHLGGILAWAAEHRREIEAAREAFAKSNRGGS